VRDTVAGLIIAKAMQLQSDFRMRLVEVLFIYIDAIEHAGYLFTKKISQDQDRKSPTHPNLSLSSSTTLAYSNNNL
jgi:hypothetical protein